jgi:hypothetical protein
VYLAVRYRMLKVEIIVKKGGMAERAKEFEKLKAL